MFGYQIDSVIHPDLVSVKVSSAPRLSLDNLSKEVRSQLPDWEITRWIVRTDPARADEVRLCPRGGHEDVRAYVNPYTGAVLGKRTWRQTTSGWLLELHYSFFSDPWGTVAIAFVATILILSSLTGLWIYRQFWKHLFRLRWKASARIFFSDLHKAVGISSMAFNFILGFTGAWWNFQSAPLLWSTELPENRALEQFSNDAISLDRMVAEAPRALPGLDLAELTIDFPFKKGDLFAVVGRAPTSNPLRSPWGSSVKFDAQSGQVVKITDVGKEPLWAQIEDTFAPLHYGLFGGLPIKILWCIFGLAPGTLAVSGFIIWSRRSFAKR